MIEQDLCTETSKMTNVAVAIVLIVGYLISPFLALIASFVALGITSESKLIALVSGFSLAFPALFYVPLATDDAYRILYIVRDMQTLPLGEAHQWLNLWAADYLNYPLFTGLMYFVARNFNEMVLPFIVAGISYTAIIYSAVNFSNLFKVPIVIKYLTVCASVMWINYLELISGMRFTMACSLELLIICEFFIFNDLKSKRQRMSLLWLLVPMLVHPGVILLLLPLLGIFWFKQKNNVLKLITLSLGIGMIIFLLSSGSSRFAYVDMLKRRWQIYQTTSFDYIASPQHIIHFCVAVFIAIIALWELNTLRKREFGGISRFKNVYRLVCSYSISLIVILISLNFGMRLVAVVPIIFIFGLSMVTSRLVKKNPSTNVEVSVLLFVIIVSGVVYNFNSLKINFSEIPFFFFN